MPSLSSIHIITTRNIFYINRRIVAQESLHLIILFKHPHNFTKSTISPKTFYFYLIFNILFLISHSIFITFA